MQIGEYKIRWIHENNHQSNSSFQGKLSKRFTHGPKDSITTCLIYQGEEKVAEGRSVCKVGDNFNKAHGRKKSLKRALAQTKIDKDQRTIIWKGVLG